MDGLNCREIALSEVLTNKDKRIDSQFWTTHIVKNPIYTYSKIGDVLLSSQYGMSVEMNTDKKGYPIFRMNELHNMLTDLEVEKYANVTSAEYQMFALQDKDVLFNRTNSYEWVGRTGIYYKNDDTPFTYASYLVKFIPDRSIVLPEYITTFLNTEIGVKAIKARARQSVNQTNVNPEEVKEIQIPLLSMKFQKVIEQLFLLANSQRLDSIDLYREAKELLEKEIGIDMYAITSGGVSVKSFAESFGTYGRLDAEYYQPKYDYILSHIKSYKHGYFILGDIIADYSTGYAFSSDDYTDVGVPLIRITNITDGRLDLSNANKIPEDKIPFNCKDYALENDILISMSGSIGLSCVVPEGIKALVNQRIMRITQDRYDSNLLSMMINSFIVNEQLRRIGTGGVQTNISATDIKNIVLPNLNNKIGEIITNKIKESTMLLEKSKLWLEYAIKAVEIAVETNEETAISWLESQKSKEI